MHLIQVPPETIDNIWPAVEKHLAGAIERSRGMFDLPSTRERLVNKQAQLWIIVTPDKPHQAVAAGTTSMHKYPSGKQILHIELLGGEDAKSWFDLKGDLEKWAKGQGCEAAIAWIRKGWAKHLQDYRLDYYLMVKEL